VDAERQISLKQLRAFVAVYRFRKLAAAADHLAVTQSAVSVLIRQMEATLGARLFDRSTRSLSPTRAAHEAIGMAERILHDVAALGESFQDLMQRKRGRVEVAVTPAIGMVLMPTAVRRFIARYPDIRVVLNDCAPDQFLARVLADSVEFGIGTPEQITSDIDAETLTEDYLCVVCTRDHRFAQRARVRWAELRGEPLIAIRGGYGVRRMVDAVVAKAGIELHIVNEAAFLTSALWMTASGMGVSILPSALAASWPYPNVVARPLVAPRVSRSISLVTRRGRSLSAACRSFVDVLRQDIAERARASTRAGHS